MMDLLLYKTFQVHKLNGNVIKMFKTVGLKITIQPGWRIGSFLDVKFNLNNGTYQPYRKPDNNPVYINEKSNHPPVVLSSFQNQSQTNTR